MVRRADQYLHHVVWVLSKLGSGEAPTLAEHIAQLIVDNRRGVGDFVYPTVGSRIAAGEEGHGALGGFSFLVDRIGVPYPLADLLNWEMNEPSTAPGDLTGIETAQIGLYAHRGQDTRTSRIQDHPVNSCTRLSCSRTPLEGPKGSTEENE